MADTILQERFIKVLNAHQKIIYKVCNLYCNTTEDRKDLFQDVVCQLWKAFPTFSGKARISTWIYRVALNTAMNHIRQRDMSRKKRALLSEIPGLYYPSRETGDDRLQLLEESIGKLPDLDKGIILLYLEGLPHEEISGIVGISTSNVGTKISRIKEKLKVMLTQGAGHGE